MLRLYKRLSIPLYVIEKPELPPLATGKELREKYRCFISRRKIYDIYYSEDPCPPPENTGIKITCKQIMVNVMIECREGMHDKCLETLRGMHVSINPYSLVSSVCAGFMTRTLEKAAQVVDEIGRRRLAERAAIVNVVWACNGPGPLSPRRLMEEGYCTPMRRQYMVSCRICGAAKIVMTVRGFARVFGPVTEDKMKNLLPRLAHLYRIGQSAPGD